MIFFYKVFILKEKHKESKVFKGMGEMGMGEGVGGG